MFDRNLRSHTGKILKSIVTRTHLVKIDPDLVSFVGFLFGLGSAVWVVVGNNLFALIFWLLNRLIDGLDGEIARLRSATSKVVNDAGGYLDITLDFIVYAAIPLSIGLAVDEKQVWMVIAFLLAGFYLNTITWTYLAALIEKTASSNGDLKTSVVMPSGLIEGAETIVFFCLFFIFFEHVELIMSVMGILVVTTALVRFVRAYAAMRNL